FLHRVDIGHFIQDEIDAREDKIHLGLDALFRLVNPEGNEEPAGLVMMLPVSVDDGDLPVVIKLFSHFGGHHGTTGPITQNYQVLHKPRLSRSLSSHERCSGYYHATVP